MNVQDWLEQAARRLKQAGLKESSCEAAFLLCDVLKKSVPEILLNRQNILQTPKRLRANRRLALRARRMPVAYIEGTQPFLDFSLRVTRDVLIPRPETESWVETLLERLGTSLRVGEVADIGTGSGCIAVAMAKHPKITRVWAVDQSAQALKVAQQNARRLGVSAKCQWLKGDLAQPLIKRKAKVSGITANLPYITTGEMRSLAPELRFEPKRALVAGKDGLLYIDALLDQAPAVLEVGGWIFLEVGHKQARAIAKGMQQAGFWSGVQIHKDLSGIERVVEGHLAREKSWTI